MNTNQLRKIGKVVGRIDKGLDKAFYVLGVIMMFGGLLAWMFWSDTLEQNFSAFTVLAIGLFLVWGYETNKHRDQIKVLEAKVSNIQDHTVKLLNMNGIVYTEYHGRAYDRDGYPLVDPGTGVEVAVMTDSPE